MAGREWLLAEASVSTPTGVTQASPQTHTLITGDIYVAWIRWRFPPGPSAKLGISFYHGTALIVPWPGADPWIYGDNEDETATVNADCFGGLNLVTYNFGAFSHSVIVSVQYQPISVTQANQNPPVPLVNRLYSSEILGNPEQVTADSEAALTVALPAGY